MFSTPMQEIDSNSCLLMWLNEFLNFLLPVYKSWSLFLL
jgi:hypothetical protein